MTRRSRRRAVAAIAGIVATAALAITALVVPGPLAGADHADLIPEPIPLDEATFTLEPVATGLRTPHWGDAAPYNTTRLFVVDQFGEITAIDIAADGVDRAPYVFLDVSARGVDLLTPPPAPDAFDERGLLGMAFHPRYRKNGLFYTYTSEPLGPTPDFTTLADEAPRTGNGSLSVIREWRVDDPRQADPVADPDSSRVLIRIEQPQKNHNAGAIVFGPDALLYIALGDGGGSDDEGPGHSPQGNGQDLAEGNLLGKILRIDPFGTNGVTGEYGIPGDNPFVGGPGPDEVFAFGFRNPWRMSFDHATGELFVGDVGQRDIEEVDLVVGGGNYGWPVKEGTFRFEGNGEAARGFATDDSPGVPADMIDPIVQYDHDEGTSVTGGFVYRGAALPDLVGSYIFGDFTLDGDLIAGRFFRIDTAGVLTEIVPTNHDDNRMLIVGFGRDTAGELYVMGIRPDGSGNPPGVVYRLAPQN